MSLNLAEAKLRLTSVLRDQVGANAALRLHFDEKLFGGSYVAKIALIKKLNKKQRGVDKKGGNKLPFSCFRKYQKGFSRSERI